MDQNANKLDLAKLRAHVGEKPRTKAGQVRQAWPEIKQLLDAGHSLKDVWQWLNEIGLQIGYARLSDYISRLRRLETNIVTAPVTVAATQPTTTEESTNHPLAHILEREKSRAGFRYNSEPDPRKLI